MTSIDWKWKMKASFIGQLLWKPVHAQHTDIVRNLDSHQKLLELELSSASTEEALRFFAEMEKKMEELRRQQTWSQNVEQSFEETGT